MLRWMLLAFMTTNALAAPQLIEVWFLSNSKVAELNKLLDRSHTQYVYRKPTAALECQEMGDFCFDPQFGLYKKEDGTDASAESMEASGTSIPVAKSVERDLINCDPKNYFDIFCGKAKAETKSISSLDVWIDTSGSMHEFDFPDKDGGCHRKSFMKKLDQSCGFNQKVNVMMFDTSIKQAGGMDSLCTNQGLNEYKRLMDWIERSEAKKLVIITDIYELHAEFADFIEKKHGKFRGDKDALTAAQLVNLVDDLAKSCK